MRPQNEMTNIMSTAFGCEIVTETLARFKFDLTQHPELRNPGLVQRCMLEYTFAYPRVMGWAGKIDGNTLIIDVNGAIDPRYYGKHEN